MSFWITGIYFPVVSDLLKCHINWKADVWSWLHSHSSRISEWCWKWSLWPGGYFMNVLVSEWNAKYLLIPPIYLLQVRFLIDEFLFYYHFLKMHAADWFIHANKSHWSEADTERVQNCSPINLQERRSWSYSESSSGKDTSARRSSCTPIVPPQPFIHSFHSTSFSIVNHCAARPFFFLHGDSEAFNLFANCCHVF